MAFYLINLTTFGSPYISYYSKNTNDENEVKNIQKIVGGYFEAFDRKNLKIHPVFNNRWTLISKLLIRPSTKVYVNEDGSQECSPNFATIITNPSLRIGGCPHLLGNVCLKVSANDMMKAGVNPDVLTLIRNEDEFEEDDEDEDYMKIKKECDENGWDFYSSAGQIFKSKM